MRPALLVAALALLAGSAGAQAALPEAPQAAPSEAARADPRAQSVPPAAAAWGDAYYQAAAADARGSSAWSASQEAGLSLNVRSPGGLEVIGDFVVSLGLDQEPSPQALVSQLFVRASPAPWMSLSAGRQRLNWGAAKIFSAIDIVEVRAEPLDIRPVLPGVSGLKVDFIPDERIGVSIVVLPAEDPRWTRGAARVELVEEDLGLDLGLGIVKYAYDGGSDDLAILSDGALSIGPIVLYEEAQVRGGRETGYFFPGMTAAEDLGGRAAIVPRAAAGMMTQIDLGLTRPSRLVIEYLYNGDGLSTAEARVFAVRENAWQNAGAPAGARIPDALGALGGFRRHYAAAALTDIAVGRFFLVGLTGILGIDSLLGWLALDAAWDVHQGTSIGLRYEIGHAFLDPSDQPTEMLLSPFQNRLTLTVSTSY